MLRSDPKAAWQGDESCVLMYPVYLRADRSMAVGSLVANPKVRMKSLFGPGSCQGSQPETASGCVVGSQALVISLQVPSPNRKYRTHH